MSFGARFDFSNIPHSVTEIQWGYEKVLLKLIIVLVFMEKVIYGKVFCYRILNTC